MHIIETNWHINAVEYLFNFMLLVLIFFQRIDQDYYK